MVPLPKPEFFVFYTGGADFPERITLSLSDSFPEGGELTLELKVNCFNINFPLGAAMLERSKTLHGYSFLIHQIKLERQKGQPLPTAIDLAIGKCKEEHLLTTFFDQYEGEVRGMLFRYLNDDEFRDFYSKNAYEDGHEDGVAAGITEGMVKGAAETNRSNAAKMKAVGIEFETICQITGLSIEEIKAL